MRAQPKVSRYRPPRAKSSPYITGEGARALRAELQQLWKIERPQVTQVVHEAAKNGDRSENGDYIYGKRRLREIDSRVRYLTQRIDNAVIIDDPPRNPNKVFSVPGCRWRTPPARPTNTDWSAQTRSVMSKILSA